MQFHNCRKIHKRDMISEFSYSKILRQAFFQESKFFYISKFLVELLTEHKDPVTQRLSRHLLNDLASTMQLKRPEYRFFTQKVK